jgi:hypothetical protein
MIQLRLEVKLMNQKEIDEWKKRIDFNSTYHETLVRLIGDAQKKGEKSQKDLERLRIKSSEITKIFCSEGILHDDSSCKEVEFKHTSTVGIDGSCQLVGGIGGKWYVPISVARVVFSGDLDSSPKIDIFWAGIKEIQENRDFKPMGKASVLMLVGETKAILNWGVTRENALVYIDGPIVDPPGYSRKTYVDDRCKALEKCLDKSIMVGCVKKSRERFFIDYLKKEKDKIKAETFPSDQHLLAFVFANLRYEGYYGPIFTSWIDISCSNKIYEKYRDRGIFIASTFFQKSASSQVLRLDVPFLEPLNENVPSIDDQIKYVAAATNHWTYPGQDYPIPVLLAHNKCNIREGCAEVLYDEILTRTKTVHPISQAISEQLR